MGDSPRPCRVVLSDALAELRDREARLARLGVELTETRAAIKALRRLVGAAAEPARPAPAVRTSTVEPDQDFKPGTLMPAAIEAVRTSLDPLSKDQIGEKIGRNGRGLAIALGIAVKDGKLTLHPQGDGMFYGIPTMAGASTEDQMLASGAR